jgi:hypothetical protein
MIVEYGSFESASDIAATPTYLRDLAQKLASSPATAVGAPQPSVAASAETSTTPLVASKPVWLRDALLQQLPANFPAVKAALYFNWSVAGSTIPIESSAASQTAFANGIASSYYATDTFGDLSAAPIAPLSESVAFLQPVADTYVALDAPWSTFGGSAPFLYVSGYPPALRKAFLRFDLSSLAGRHVDQAVLQVTATTDANAPLSGVLNVKYNANTQWQEAWTSWNNGLGQWDVAPTPIGTLNAPNLRAVGYTVTLPVATVQPALGRLLSLQLDTTAWDDFVFASREASDPLARPQLILAYH